MPRKYKRNPLSRRYGNFSKDDLDKAVAKKLARNVSYRQLEKKYDTPFATIQNKIKRKHMKTPEGQITLSEEFETKIVEHIFVCTDFGQPLTFLDVRMIVK